MVGRLTVISPLLRVPGTGCPSSGASPRPLHALREDRPAPPGRHSGTNGNARVCFVCFPRFSLVLCLLNGWCFAARIFPSRRGASDEHIPQWICKERATKPGAKRTAALWVAPSLACGFVARRSQPHCGGCSLLAPRHRPNWAQQNTSHLGDTTLVWCLAYSWCFAAICDHLRSQSAQSFTKESLNTFVQEITKRRCPRNTTTC